MDYLIDKIKITLEAEGFYANESNVKKVEHYLEYALYHNLGEAFTISKIISLYSHELTKMPPKVIYNQITVK
jgi:hypothetical protein